MSNPKNPNFIVELIKDLSIELHKFTFLWVGDGDKREYIEKRIQQEKLQKFVVFAGAQKKVEPFFSAMDVFVLPSLWEGLPVVAVEAQASGTPCLLSSNITKEVNISPLVKYIPIENGAKTWANEITCLTPKKKDVCANIINSGFDTKNNSKWLCHFYKRITDED